MQLNKLIIEPRVRTAWAAIDLGTVLGRKFWWRGVGLYLVLALPVFLLTRLTTDISGWLPYFILWWLKPLFERPLLFSLSRELFSEPTSFGKTLTSYKLWFWPSLLSVLTVRRISVNRSMFAPVSLLEQPSSSDYGKRVSVLGFKFSNASTWLTVVLYHFESFIAIALLTMLAFLFPDMITDSLAWLSDLSDNNLIMDTTVLLIMAAVAPFYCAAGFSLYICRRIELEGWDIEMCFRDWMLGYSRPQEHAEALSQSRTEVSHD